MSKNWMILLASASLALVGCSDKDSADDSGEAGDTDGADGTGFTSEPVSGAAEAYFTDDALVGSWAVSGQTIDCGGCLFGFDGDFTASGGDFAEDFSRQVEWDAAGYVYTDGGEYWGYGGASNGYAAWATYDASTSGYYYYGAVSY